MESPLNSPASTPTNTTANSVNKKNLVTVVKKEKDENSNASNHIQPQGGNVTPDKGKGATINLYFVFIYPFLHLYSF